MNGNLDFYARAGIQNLCNAQSKRGFRCVEKFARQENSRQNRVAIEVGKVVKFSFALPSDLY